MCGFVQTKDTSISTAMERLHALSSFQSPAHHIPSPLVIKWCLVSLEVFTYFPSMSKLFPVHGLDVAPWGKTLFFNPHPRICLEEGEREKERGISMWETSISCPPYAPQPRIEPARQEYALTRN